MRRSLPGGLRPFIFRALVVGFVPQIPATTTTTTTTTTIQQQKAGGCAYGRVPVNETGAGSDATEPDFEGPCHCDEGFEPFGLRLGVEEDLKSLCADSTLIDAHIKRVGVEASLPSPFYPPPDHLKTLWGENYCVPCMPGYGKPVPGDTVCEICAAGRYAKECATGSCAIADKGAWAEFGATGQQECPASTFNPISGGTSADSCLSCPTNSASTALKATNAEECICLEGFFGSPSGSDFQSSLQMTSPCFPCPKGAVCKGGNFPRVRPLPKAGYYDVSEELESHLVEQFGVLEPWQLPVTAKVVIVECKTFGACLGNQTCLHGMKGPLCDTCIKGWYRPKKSATCTECPGFFQNARNIGIVAGGFVFVAYFIVKRVSAAIESRPVHAIMLKIGYSYFLMTSAAFRACDITLPDYINVLMFGSHITHFLKQTTVEETPQQDIMSIDCLFEQLHEWFTTEYFDSVPQFRLAMALTLPIQVVVFIIIIECLMYFSGKCLKCLKGCAVKNHDDEEEGNGKSVLESFGRLIPYLLMIFFCIQPLLAQEYFQGLLCIPLTEDYPDAIFFQYDIGQSCSEAGQKIRFGSLIGLGFWCTGFPALLVLYLRRRIFDLYDATLCKNLGLLYNGYEEQFYYWEVVIFIRKVAILGCFIVPMRSDLSKITDLICMSMIFLGLHLWANPYDNRYYWLLDRLETKILWSFLFTTVCGLYQRIRKLYPEPDGGWPVDWTDPTYMEDQVVKYAIVSAHLRFVLHYLFFIAYEFFLKNNPCFADGKVQYDPVLKEWDISKLSTKERHFLAAALVDSVRGHVDDLKWFTFRYVEAAFKESLFEILHEKAVFQRDLDELLGKTTTDDKGPGSPKGKDGKDHKKKNPVVRICKMIFKLICSKKKKKTGGGASARDDEDGLEVDWKLKISLEKIQLRMLRRVQFPVDTFRKDLARGKQKSTCVPIDDIDEKTGLSIRCVNIKTRKEKQKEDAEKRSMKNRIKQLLDTPEKRAKRAAEEEEQEKNEVLFGKPEKIDPYTYEDHITRTTKEVTERHENKAELVTTSKKEKPVKKSIWKPSEWMKPTITEGEATVAGTGGPRSVTTLDYITSMVASFDRRHGGPEFVLPPELNPKSGMEGIEDAAPTGEADDEEAPAEIVPETGIMDPEDPMMADPNAPLLDAGAGVGLEEEVAEAPPKEEPAPPQEAPALPEPPKEGTSGAGDPLSIAEAPAEGTSGAGDPLAIPENPNMEAAAEAPAHPSAEAAAPETSGEAEAPAKETAAASPAPDAEPAVADTPEPAKEGDVDAKSPEAPEGEAAAAAPLPAPAIEVPAGTAQAEPAKS